MGLPKNILYLYWYKIVIEAELADSLWKQFIGLSFSEKHNLFFQMPCESNWGCHMFGMRYPLKMVFIDKNKKVVDVQDALPWTLNPKTWKSYEPKLPCKFILETPFDLDIKVNDVLAW